MPFFWREIFGEQMEEVWRNPIKMGERFNKLIEFGKD
jgi:hypothetical protein